MLGSRAERRLLSTWRLGLLGPVSPQNARLIQRAGSPAQRKGSMPNPPCGLQVAQLLGYLDGLIKVGT
jgi:hypothetical protein